MNILVTGATGVIGRSIIKRLSNRSFYIDATYYKNKPSKKNSKNINYLYYEDLFNLKSEKKYDYIWHFATYGQPAKFINSWENILKLNVYDLQKLTNLLKEDGHFFYASSSEIYGNNKSDEFTIPASDPLAKRAIYTESKRLGEAILNKILGDRCTLFRICLAYSPEFIIGDNRVLYELIVKGLKQDFIQLLDDGASLRQYIFIDDAIDMMENIAFNFPTKKSSNNGAWNICNPEHFSILEMAKIIGKFLQKPVIKGNKNNNPFHALSKVDIIPTRYINTFGNFKYISLEIGIQKVIESAKSQLFSDK